MRYAQDFLAFFVVAAFCVVVVRAAEIAAALRMIGGAS